MPDALIPNASPNAAPRNPQPRQALEASNVLSATKGVLYQLDIYNSNAATQFVQLHDAAALPADAVIPAWVYKVPAASSIRIDFGTHGKAFNKGCVVCNSSTAPTKTIGAADCMFSATFKGA